MAENEKTLPPTELAVARATRDLALAQAEAAYQASDKGKVAKATRDLAIAQAKDIFAKAEDKGCGSVARWARNLDRDFGLR